MNNPITQNTPFPRPENPDLVTRARIESLENPGKAVLLVAVNPGKGSQMSRKFLAHLRPLEKGFSGALVIRQQDVHPHLLAHQPDAADLLDHFAYTRVPRDGGDRHHFPCGAVYMNGEEVYRLPADATLASMTAERLAKNIGEKTDLAFNSAALVSAPGRG